MKRLIFGLLFVLASTAALAQPPAWQVPNNAVPVGKGAGKTGFGSVTGSAGAGGKCLTDTNPPTFTACPNSVGTLTQNHIFVGNASNVPADVVMSGHCTIVANGAITCTNLNYIAPGTGGTVQTQARYNQNVLWAHDYGAVCDGTTNDATAFQNLINEAITLRVPARFSGVCKINTALSITGTVDFGGTGLGYTDALAATGGGSTLLVAANINGININTDFPVFLSSFAIAASAVTSGKGITITSGGTTNYNSVFDKILVIAFDVNIHFIKAASWKVINSSILSCATICVVVEDQFNADAGDQFFSNNTVSGTGTTTNLLEYHSGGGLKVLNNKFNTGTNGFTMIWNGAVSSGLLLVANNGFEGVQSAIVLSRTGGVTTVFARLSFVNNEMSTASGGYCMFIPTDGTGTWLSVMSIIGGTCTIGAGGVAGFSFDTIDTFTVSGTSFQTGSVTAPRIALGANAVRGTVGPFSWDNGTYGANALNGNKTVTCSAACF